MDTGTYDATIREVTEISDGLSDYLPYVNRLIGNARSCDELVTIVAHINVRLGESHTRLNQINTKVIADVSAHQTSIAAQIAVLAPLMVSPTNLAELLTWAAAVTQVFIGPHDILVAQNVALDVQLARVTDAIAPALASMASAVVSLNSTVSSQQQLLGCGSVPTVVI